MNLKDKDRLRKQLREYAEDDILRMYGERNESAIYQFMSGVEAALNAVEEYLYKLYT